MAREGTGCGSGGETRDCDGELGRGGDFFCDHYCN